MYSNVVAAAAELASETCCRVKWSKQRKMYECTRCGYNSERKSNVGRHFRRIHCQLKKPRLCVVCETNFYTKGEFYEHCEKEHPHLRNANYITSEKYKIGKKQNRRQTRSSSKTSKSPTTSYMSASVDEASEEETTDSTFCDNDNENVNRNEDPAEFEEIETYEISEVMEEYQEEYQEDGEKSQTEQENIELMYELQKDDENLESDYIPLLHEGEMEKVIVQQISDVYAPIPYPTPNDDDSSSWSHKANESLTSSPVRSLRTDFLSPILWTPTSYKLPTTPSSSTESDEPASSPARTIKTADFIFSPARSIKTDDSILSPARSLKFDDSSSANSDASDDYLSSPTKVYKTNEFMSSTVVSQNVFSSTSKCSPKVEPSVTFAYCNVTLSSSDAVLEVSTSSSLSSLPLKKRFGNLSQRQYLADITNAQNNEFNVKSRFNNNEMQVANRNFPAVNDNQQAQAFFKNIDFDDLEAVLILKSLKESNH